MIDAKDALSAIPAGLRDPLLNEYSKISQNYFEHRWEPSELSGGRFCEVVYTILDGHAKSAFAAAPAKPANFPQACRNLENNTHAPRSFQILIPRLLPALYEIRNNRGVGHVGGDVDSNPMDATAVLTMASWILAELVRVFHGVDIPSAQKIVDALAERPMPLVWEGGGTKRVLVADLKLREHMLVLLASSAEPVPVAELQAWMKYGNRQYLRRLLVDLDDERLVLFDEGKDQARILPPGVKIVSDLIERART
jgi:hypothetical protein